MLSQEQALRKALDWIDGVPQDLALPTMPGFDRDWLESMMDGQLQEDDEPLTYPEAISMVLDWIDAVPEDIKADLPPFDRAEVSASI
ncbi:hypothetical protein ACI2KR_06550 [Pseudomonas luteola]